VGRRTHMQDSIKTRDRKHNSQETNGEGGTGIGPAAEIVNEGREDEVGCAALSHHSQNSNSADEENDMADSSDQLKYHKQSSGVYVPQDGYQYKDPRQQ
jgi:hypothetical protein